MPSLARNAVLNFSGQVFPAVVAVVCVPPAVRLLGTERFGLLSIILVMIGYLSVLDLGLGVAVTKMLAQALACHGNGQRVRDIFWTAFFAQLGMGALAGGGLALFTPASTEHFLNIPASLSREASVTFYLCALALPIVMVSSSVVGLLQAAQRFDLTVKVQLPLAVIQYAIPLICGWISPRLPVVVSALLVCRILSFSIMLRLARNVFPDLFYRCWPKKSELSALIRFGGWITVGNTISPVMVYADRFLIGALISLGAVTYYSVPLDASMRVLLIPTSLVGALFPVLSSLAVNEHSERNNRVARQALKYIICFTGIPVILLLVFARDILKLWMGAAFATQSTTTMQILLLGILANSAARLPLAVLQALDRPDILPKFQMIAAPVQLALAVLLLKRLGLVGAAIAWTLRLVVEMLFLFQRSHRLAKMPVADLFSEKIGAATLYLLAFGVGGLAILSLAHQSLFHAGLCAVMAIGGFAGIWWYFLNGQDRSTILRAIRGAASDRAAL